MFKNAIIYKAVLPAISLGTAEQALMGERFAPCLPTQDKSYGWVPPRSNGHGPLIESIGGHWVAKFAIQTKSVPSEAVNRRLSELIEQIKEEEGRAPGRKETRELKAVAVHDLLPKAFPKTTHVLVWFDLANGRIVLDTASQSKSDHVITSIVQLFDGIRIAPLNTEMSPQAVMTSWLLDGDKLDAHDRFDFCIGRHVELHSDDEMQSVVKFDRHHLDDGQMRLHIGQGKLPTKLALDWDGRVLFVLTEGGALRKITFLVSLIENKSDQDVDAFDSDVAITTGELGPMIDDLTTALGGAIDIEDAQASTETPAQPPHD